AKLPSTMLPSAKLPSAMLPSAKLPSAMLRVCDRVFDRVCDRVKGHDPGEGVEVVWVYLKGCSHGLLSPWRIYQARSSILLTVFAFLSIAARLPFLGDSHKFLARELHFVGKLVLGVGFFADGERIRADLFELLGDVGEGKSKEEIFIREILFKGPGEWREVRVAGDQHGYVECVSLCQREHLAGDVV
ncbi:MAG TPA: hypothetical protein VJ952_08875, partial [Opitutales bacterium]|nr:hypothetical protein [Opitutales bacterium]